MSAFKAFGLTNWSAETFPFAFSHYRFLDDFEGIVVSGEEKMNKPDKRIYYTLLERYHLKADDCIFIDDNQANVDMANKIGIHAILWEHNPEKFGRRLKRSKIFLLLMRVKNLLSTITSTTNYRSSPMLPDKKQRPRPLFLFVLVEHLLSAAAKMHLAVKKIPA